MSMTNTENSGQENGVNLVFLSRNFTWNFCHINFEEIALIVYMRNIFVVGIFLSLMLFNSAFWEWKLLIIKMEDPTLYSIQPTTIKEP